MTKARIRRVSRSMWVVKFPKDPVPRYYTTWSISMRKVDEFHWRRLKIEHLKREVEIREKSLHEHCPPDTAWFAWYPVLREGDIVWLMWVARHRCHSFLGRWHYRPVHHAPEVKR